MCIGWYFVNYVLANGAYSIKLFCFIIYSNLAVIYGPFKNYVESKFSLITNPPFTDPQIYRALVHERAILMKNVKKI